MNFAPPGGKFVQLVRIQVLIAENQNPVLQHGVMNGREIAAVQAGEINVRNLRADGT